MNISAINANTKTNFKGNDIEELAKSVKTLSTKKLDEMSSDDFNGIAKKIDADKHTAPIQYFIATAALAAASFMAARKASMLYLKGTDGKFPIYNTVDKAAELLQKGYTKARNSITPVQVKNVKTFFQNAGDNALKFAKDFAEKGITEADRTLNTGATAALLPAKNAVRKLASGAVGVGAAGMTIAKRNEDENGNGIPDGAEKSKKGALGVMKGVAEALPTIAAAVNLA